MSKPTSYATLCIFTAIPTNQVMEQSNWTGHARNNTSNAGNEGTAVRCLSLPSTTPELKQRKHNSKMCLNGTTSTQTCMQTYTNWTSGGV